MAELVSYSSYISIWPAVNRQKDRQSFTTLYLTEQNCYALLFGIVGTFSLPRLHKPRNQPEQVVLMRQKQVVKLGNGMGMRPNDEQISVPVCSLE